MTEAEHKQRHIELHKYLDELLADWLGHQPAGTLFSNTTIMELMQWSHSQALDPAPLPHYAAAGKAAGASAASRA